MIQSQYDQLKATVEAMAPDVAKANAGNKSAKIRIRASLQALKKTAQDFRISLIEKSEA